MMRIKQVRLGGVCYCAECAEKAVAAATDGQKVLEDMESEGAG